MLKRKPDVIDSYHFQTGCPTIKVQRFPKPLKVKGLGTKLHDAQEYATIDLFLLAINGRFRNNI